MYCIRIIKLLNQAKIEGYNWIVMKELSDKEIQDIEECGFFIKKTKNGYKVSDRFDI